MPVFTYVFADTVLNRIFNSFYTSKDCLPLTQRFFSYLFIYFFLRITSKIVDCRKQYRIKKQKSVAAVRDANSDIVKQILKPITTLN